MELRSQAYLDSADVGFRQIYDLEYDAALATFSSLEARYPDHPGPPLGAAAAIWLRELFERQEYDLGKFVAPGYFNKDSDRTMPVSERQFFIESVDRSLKLSEAVIEREPTNRDARFFEGTAEGLLAAFAYTVDGSTMEAFGHAKKAYQSHHELIEEDPGYSDAYVSVGVYEYIIDNLRWYLKWPAKMIGYRGSEERGIEYLETARRQGSSSTDEATAMLMVIYFREKKFQHALSIARALRHRFPQNFLFHIDEAQILERMGRKQDAVREYLKIVVNAEESRPNYQELPLDRFRYDLGRRLRRLGRFDAASALLRDCLESSDTADSERALCHLEAGLIDDEVGRRELAVEHYRATLALPRIGDSHKVASRYLRTPYRGS